MTGLGTIVLTMRAPELVSAVSVAMPGLQMMVIGSFPPVGPIDGPVWCFVDWLLADISGLEMCRRLREAKATASSRITLILEEGEIDSRRRALRAGADDYLVGPLTPELFVARLGQYRAWTGGVAALSIIELGDLTVDCAAQQARWCGRSLTMPPNEFRLLTHFVQNPDRVFPRRSLIATLGKEAGEVDERTVDVWIGRLRRAMRVQGAPDPVRTVRSMGYVCDSRKFR